MAQAHDETVSRNEDGGIPDRASPNNALVVPVIAGKVALFSAQARRGCLRPWLAPIESCSVYVGRIGPVRLG